MPDDYGIAFMPHLRDYIKDLVGYLDTELPHDALVDYERGKIGEEEFLRILRTRLRAKAPDEALNAVAEKLQSKVDEAKARLAAAQEALRKDSFAVSKEELTSLIYNLIAAIGKIEQRAHRMKDYAAHFAQESRWRILDVASHLVEGRIHWFGEPAQGPWIWVVTVDRQLIIGNRQDILHGGYEFRLPHATLAKGDAVLGAGELYISHGIVTEYNTHSGHYVLQEDVTLFNERSRRIFEEALRELHIWHGPAFVEKSIQ